MQITLLLFFAALAGARSETLAAADVASRVVGFRPETIDLGQIPTQQVVRTWLHFHNESDNPVELVDFESSCGCATLLPLPPVVIEAGTSVPIEVSVDSMYIAGSIRREISARSSAGKVFKCWLDLEVVQPISCTPGFLDFGDLSRNAQPCQTFALCSAYADFGEPLCDSPWIEVRAVCAEQAMLVDVTVVDERMPMGRVFGHVLVPLRTPEQPHVFIPVRARRIDAVPRADDIRSRVHLSHGEQNRTP